jgi:hypothetical protein
MFLTLGVIFVASASLAVIVDGLRKAPEGYEDETGFHVIQEYSLNRPSAGWRFRTGRKGLPLRPGKTGELDVGLRHVPHRA